MATKKVERREFDTEVGGKTVTLRHAVREGEGDHHNFKLRIGGVYRGLAESWPAAYVSEDGHLSMPPMAEFDAALKAPGSDIWEALRHWCDNDPNTSDKEVRRIVKNIEGSSATMTTAEWYHLAEIFLEAHN
jgi:hypothetical protein